MSEEMWVCDTCQHQIPKTSGFGFVGWMSDIARHVAGVRESCCGTNRKQQHRG